MRHPRTGWKLPAAVGAVLVAANVANNRVLPDRDLAYVGSCLSVAGGLVALARVDGSSWEDLGLHPGRLRGGARWGLAAGGAALALGLVSVATPAGRAALRDERVRRGGRHAALRAALVRVPLGTVALEEVAFRAVVPAVLRPRLGPGRAAAAGAGLFGLWHVLPSTTLAADNEAVGLLTEGSARRATAFAVATTTVAGLGFGWLRDRSGSVLAPALLHWTTNGAGYLAAALPQEARR
jgi:uncharacterized protein